MSGAGDINHIKGILIDDPIEMHVDEVQARRGAPVSQQSRLSGTTLARVADSVGALGSPLD
jgi:hypothetical protein